MRHQHSHQSKTSPKSTPKESASFRTLHAESRSPHALIMHLQRTVGNRAVDRLIRSGRLQATLKISHPQDKYEQEADRVAEQVMRMPMNGSTGFQPVGESGHSAELQRKCAACASGTGLCPQCATEENVVRRKPLQITPLVQRQGMMDRPEEEEERIQPKSLGHSAAGEENNEVPSTVPDVLRSSGQPLDPSTRAFFEPRFGHDFSQVRVHADGRAAESARSVNALAYTVGRDVVFGAGQYAPGTSAGQRLLAHELTHVVQQESQRGSARLQRQNECDDPDFCTPYATTIEATAAEAWLRSYFLPVMSAKFGTEVHDLWESFLSRAPGASLARQVFDIPGNPIEESFATSSATEDDQNAVLDLVINRVTRFPGRRLSPHTYTLTSLTNYLSASEMDNRPINYSNPLSKAGNIAGGIGSSDAGPDFRKIASANVGMEKVPLIGNSGYINFELIPHYEVYDAVDLCPGQCGSLAEQIFTIPLSRLEASREAYDVPYVVRFQPEPRTKREFYSSFPI